MTRRRSLMKCVTLKHLCSKSILPLANTGLSEGIVPVDSLSVHRAILLTIALSWTSEVFICGGSEDTMVTLNMTKNKRQFDCIFETLSSTGCGWAWIDVLVFPQNATDEKVIVQVQNSVADVLRNAEKVVVLDAFEMVTVDTGYAAAVLICSSWMGRAASYSEAVLAKEVVFLMGHGTDSIVFPYLLERNAQENPDYPSCCTKHSTTFDGDRRVSPTWKLPENALIILALALQRSQYCSSL